MRRTRQYFVLPALPIAFFLAGALYLQMGKAAWVDECYTYYGITHETFGPFVDSICSGINFSPPLYFLLNWIFQLIFSVPIEALRVESALWISLGAFLIFARCAKSFGFLSSFLGLTLVLLQSNLLIEQAMEARHYGMFFAASCMILFLLPSDAESNSSSRKTLYFVSLLALGLTHYLGIVFCAIAGFARFWCLRKEGPKSALPLVEISCSAILAGSYLALLHKQSSHLNTWGKDNSIEALLSQYLDSAAPLSVLVILIPMLIFLPHSTSQNLKQPDIKNKSLAPLLTVSALWILVPFFFWVLSHISPLNLFQERYFIPKEAAFIILVSFGINKLKRRFGELKPLPSGILLLIPCLISFGIFALNAKRTHFSLDPSVNYHHWLLIKKDQRKIMGDEPIIHQGDHLFFPNLYTDQNNQHFLLINEPELLSTYAKFSSKINCMQKDSLRLLDNFHFISADGELPKRLGKSHSINSSYSLSKYFDAKVRSYSKTTD